MSEQARAKFNIYAIGRVGEHIRPQNSKDGLEQCYRNKTNNQHIERAHATMHEHLVDHHLEE